MGTNGSSNARVERVFRGSVGDVVSWEGHTLSHLSCGQDLLGDQLEVNDRLFVAAEADPGYGPRLLVWRWMNGRWRFADEALQDVANGGEPYPGAARDVHTTAAILRLIDRLPDTSTDEQIHGDDVGTAADWSTVRVYVVGSIFLATFCWLTARPTRHRRRDLTAIDAVRGAPNQAVVPEADAG